MESPIAAVKPGHHGVVQLLLEKGANPDGDVSTGTHNCVEAALFGYNQLCYERTPLS
jgi:hypothetical protein